MPPVFPLTIMTPEQIVFRGRARSLVAPGAEGYFGVLAHHAPMVAELQTGRLSFVEEAGGRKLFALSSGILETGGNQVTILADSMETAEEIDVSRARAAERRARERLSRHGEDIDVARAQAALQRALNRLRAAEEARE